MNTDTVEDYGGRVTSMVLEENKVQQIVTEGIFIER